MRATPLYLCNARLIDGSGDPVSDEPFALLIEGKRIVQVAPQRELDCRDGVTSLDLAGMTIMPGLIDCHDHLADLEGSMQQRAARPPTLAIFKTAAVFHDTLLGGCTGIRDASGVDQGMKMAVEQGLISGPRLKISVVILSQLGGHNDHTEPAGIDSRFPKLDTVPSGICDGVDECRRKTREVIRAGADWIKIATTGGCRHADRGASPAPILARRSAGDCRHRARGRQAGDELCLRWRGRQNLPECRR